jgi:hypothetical protein
MGAHGIAAGPFSFNAFTIKRPWPSFLGRNFTVHDPNGNPCLFVQHKLLTFKDEWNIFSDSSASQSLVRVKARQAIGVNIETDVMDAMTGQVVGTVRSKGFKSIVRDTWEVLGPNGNVAGELVEDSNGMLRRLVPTVFGMPLIPGKWHLAVNGQVAMEVEEERVFFGKSFKLKLMPNAGVDARFAIGCALLALMKEIMREAS